MKWMLPLVLLAVLALAPAAAGGADVRRCGAIGFTPNSDDIASGIRARGVTCKAARAFVRASDGRPGRRFRGFACTKRARDTPLPSWRYRCTSDGRMIRWIRT